ncbi:MAG: transglutaminaseTgpA domain-containing protein [Nocardioides sp.]
MPAEAPGIHPLLILLGLLLLVASDAVACSMRRVPLAGLFLLAAYALPTSLLVGGVSWVLFVLVAGGYLTMVLLDEDDRLARWGGPSRARAVGSPRRWRPRARGAPERSASAPRRPQSPSWCQAFSPPCSWASSATGPGRATAT